MRRIAAGCTTESHPLMYGQFMSRLSSCIFEWDASEIERLMSAKEQEIIDSDFPSICSNALKKAINRGAGMSPSLSTGGGRGNSQSHRGFASSLLGSDRHPECVAAYPQAGDN